MGVLDFMGDWFNHDARNRAANANYDSRDTFKDLNGDVDTQQVGPTELANAPADARNAQMEALNRFANIGATQGMDDSSKAAMQQAQMSNAQQARSANEQALERARTEGRLNSGRALSASVQANQGAANANAMAGAQAVQDARARAMQAMAAQGTLGGQVRGQDYQRAGAQDAVNQYNANMRNQAQTQSFQQNLARAHGIQSANQDIAGMNNQRAQQARDSAGAIGDAAVTGIEAAATGGASLGVKAAGAAAGAAGKARGGVIEGHAKEPGDSPKNDTVPAMLSPGEVVVPRSVVSKGPDAAREFIRKLLAGE